jgi:MerR family copper efflux transcriptional regulator
MRIGELSRKSGMAASAIRFYEEQGLLPPPLRAANGYRHYGGEVVQQLQRIQLAKNLGFSLETIRGFFSDTGECSKEKTLAQTVLRLREIEQLQATLATQYRDLLALRALLEDGDAAGVRTLC